MNGIFFLHLDVEVPCCCLVVYFGNLILGFLVRGDSGEGGVAGFWMRGDGVICTVYGGLGTVMVVGVAICSVYVAAGDVSFSDVQLSACWRRRSGRRWWRSSNSYGPLASRGFRQPPTFGPHLVDWWRLVKGQFDANRIFSVSHPPERMTNKLVLTQGPE